MVVIKKDLNEIIANLYNDSMNLSRLLIREAVKLKLNKSTIYQNRINNYCMKQLRLIKYVNNLNCNNVNDYILRRYLLLIARSYNKVLYIKYLDLVDLLYNRRYDDFEKISKKNNFKKRFNQFKYKYIKHKTLNNKSKEIKKNHKYIKRLFFNIFDDIEFIISHDDKFLLHVDNYDFNFINYCNNLVIDILD